jgi:methyl-accepting chemotaxis protein
MAGLAEAIGSMTLSMSTMADRLDKQTGEADRQIEEAVRRFGQASEEMRAAFGELNRNFEAVATRMREESEASNAQARDQLSTLLQSLGGTLDGMREGLAQAAGEMGAASSRAANDAARIGQEALESSFSSFVERFSEAGSPLVASMKDASVAISGSATELQTSQTAIGDHARSIESVAARSDKLAAAFGSVADDIKAATVPVRHSADAIERAVVSVQQVIADQAESNEAAREEVTEMAAALRQTSEAAASAWADYRARFNEVDESLGDALNQLTDAASGHAQNLNERVGQIDSALGNGIAQLAGALEPLTTLRDTVEELASVMSRPTVPAE